MKIEEICSYFKDKNISHLSKTSLASGYEEVGIHISLNNDDKLELYTSTYTPIKSDELDLLKFLRTGSSNVIDPSEYNLDIEFRDDSAIVTLVRYKIGNQNIKHVVFKDLEMCINYKESLGDVLANNSVYGAFENESGLY